MTASCQSCRAPLDIDPSLLIGNELNQILENLLDSHICKTCPQSISQSDVRINDSFVVLPESKRKPFKIAEEDQGSLSGRIATAEDVFRVLCGISRINHPLCMECGEELIRRFDKRMHEIKVENQAYAFCLRQLEEESRDHDELEEELARLAAEENDAIRALTLLEAECEQTEGRNIDLETRIEDALVEEQRIFHALDLIQDQSRERIKERMGDQIRIKSTQQHLECIQSANVYHDSFKISHDGAFGTINGLRLGKLPGEAVEWVEINAALGQTVLLLDVIASKLHFTFSNYRLIPLGNYSRIERIVGDRTMYELYGSGDFSGLLFRNRRFDSALGALLECIQQLANHAGSLDAAFFLPYRIEQDRVGDVPVRYQFNQDETWTKAMKFMLTDIKSIVAFFSSWPKKQNK